MTIEYHCGTCQKLLRVADEAAGRKARCPECGAIQTVPGNPTESPPILAQPFPSVEPFSGAGQGPSDPVLPTQPANPFAEKTATSFSVANPYAPPQHGRPIDVPGKVKPPAICMLVLAIIQILFTALVLLGGFLSMFDGGPDNEDLMTFGWFAANLLMQFFIAFGAWRMIQLRSYGLSLASAILIFLPCSGCCVLGIPVGIWALIVLLDGTVRSAFQ